MTSKYFHALNSYLLEINITEHQFLVTAVYDSGPVTAGKHITDSTSPELAEYCGLSSKNNL